MGATIVVGAIFAAIFIYAAYKTIKSIRNNSCPGCSAG